jgi:hypothetical protein
VSVVTVLRPLVRLAKLLREPGGLALADALAAAQKNLEAASGDYLYAVGEGVADIARLAERHTSNAFDEAVFSGVYARASNLIGAASVCGRASIDEALTSLCEMLDCFQSREIWDAEAVGVHVNALRLLLYGGVSEDSDGAATVLDGLRRVSKRYQLEAAAL